MIPVVLFVKGRRSPISTIQIYQTERNGDDANLVNMAFRIFVFEQLFYESIKDYALLLMLTRVLRELRSGVPWYKQTFHFLRIDDSASKRPSFILTTSTSDFLDRYERISQIVVDGSQLIRQVVKMAINERTVTIDDVKILFELNLFRPSTTFRSELLFPGEVSFLRYDFTENKIRYLGLIGFDQDFKLLSIEERLPESKLTYLR